MGSTIYVGLKDCEKKKKKDKNKFIVNKPKETSTKDPLDIICYMVNLRKMRKK